MVDVINELTDLTDVSKQGLKLMKIVILRALGAQGGYLELARPCHRITLIELDLISSTSHYYSPGVTIRMVCCVSTAKMYFQGRKFDES